MQFPYADVLAATNAWLASASPVSTELLEGSLEERVQRLEPLQTPASRQLVMPAGYQWTAHLMGNRSGGDSVSWVGHLSRELSCVGILATHIPAGQSRYPCTMFELLGPEGPPPLHYVRTITAGIFDSGRWTFELSGTQLSFEEPETYAKPRKRDRFTRPMLTRYLAAAGIDVDDPGIYGRTATLFTDAETYDSRELTIAQARALHATVEPLPTGGPAGW